jgi:hypothetical protein
MGGHRRVAVALGKTGEGNEICTTEAQYLSRFESTKQLELRFRALLTNGMREVRFERVALN